MWQRYRAFCDWLALFYSGGIEVYFCLQKHPNFLQKSMYLVELKKKLTHLIFVRCFLFFPLRSSWNQPFYQLFSKLKNIFRNICGNIFRSNASKSLLWRAENGLIRTSSVIVFWSGHRNFYWFCFWFIWEKLIQSSLVSKEIFPLLFQFFNKFLIELVNGWICLGLLETVVGDLFKGNIIVFP